MAVVETLPDIAVILVVPALTPLASPFEPAALLMVATAVLVELQVTVVVRFCVELSEYVPVAVNCWVAVAAMLGFAGVTDRDTSVAGVIVSVAVPETVPEAAVIVVGPVASEVARPYDPAALLMVATAVSDELQAAIVVRFCVDPSEYDPVAMNC